MGIALLITILTCLTISFAINDVGASLAEHIKPRNPIKPEINSSETYSADPEVTSRTQDQSESNREKTNDSIMPYEPHAEAESDVTSTNTTPNEVEYCNADLVDDNTFQGYTIKAGTDNADQLIGTANKDLILGLDGDDKIQGSGADDIICGGNGQDHLVGDSYPNVGQDHLVGESYPNVIISQPGNLGKDFIFGQEGDDIINSNKELERDYGDPGDILFGGPGDDAVTGNDGNDKLSGGNGNDNLDAGDGKDQLDGGPGDDGCYDNQVETFETFVNCEEQYDDPPTTIYKKNP